MLNFDDLEAIKKIDPQDTLGSTEFLPKQLSEAWKEIETIKTSIDKSLVQNVVFCGMGASIYGALVLKALQGRNMPYPIEIISDYHLPAYVNKNTLVVLTSYSGSTEEVLSCAEEAKQMNAQMLVLTKGGKLAEFAKKNNVPAYIFDGKLNPAGVPRLGCGYTILGLVGLLSQSGIINVEMKEMQDAIIRVSEKVKELKDQAILDSEKFFNKIPIIIAAEHLSGNAQIFRNQFNETSKTFSAYYLVPDLNHHLMEGLMFPEESNLQFIVLNSKNYETKIKKRMELTVDVLKQNKHVVHEFNTSGATVYDDFLEVLIYGSNLTLYLALRHDQNPAVNPWVDYFKEKLAS